MDSDQTSHDFLLDTNDEKCLLKKHREHENPFKRFCTDGRTVITTAVAAGTIILLCIVNIITLHSLKATRQASAALDTDRLQFRQRTSQTMYTSTQFSSSDPAVANAAWDSYKINGFVALPHSWVSDLTRGEGPFGRPMPSDPSKGIYVVDGMHQLHCLMSVRSLVQKLLSGESMQNRTHVERHLDHCYDALRQAIICRADATPLYVPSGDSFYSGDGQIRQCADWQSLEAWTLQHTACYGGVQCWSDEEIDITVPKPSFVA